MIGKFAISNAVYPDLLMVVRSRAINSNIIFGFVVGASKDLLLLHSFDSEAFCLNGYEVIRFPDIREVCWFNHREYWRYRAIRKLKIKPTAPAGIDLESMPALLRSISHRYPLFSVHHERGAKRTCYVGRILSATDTTFVITDSDYYGREVVRRRMRFEDVTRVCFDGGFLNASALTVRQAKWKH